MRTVVVYESKYGATRKYAEWLAEALSCELYERKSITTAGLHDYDTIIYGGGLYAGRVSGISLLIKNFDSLRNKNIILFTCGLMDPSDPDNIEGITQSLSLALTPEMREVIKFFHLRGGIDYKKLGFMHKSMMATIVSILKKKDYKTLKSADKIVLDTYGKTADFTDRETIAPIVEYVGEIVNRPTLVEHEGAMRTNVSVFKRRAE